jgi:signal transduction histidine kinase
MTSHRRRANWRVASEGAGAGASAAVAAPAERRLEHLYEISKLFARFETIDQTFEPALGIVSKTLPLRTAVLIEAEDAEDGGQSRMVVWRSEGQSSEQQQEVKAHVEEAYRYLVGAGSTESLDLLEHAGKTTLPRRTDAAGSLGKRLIVIPLAVPNYPPFGTLALEGARTLDEKDLMFVNAITNQLAMALDRKRAWQVDITRREHAEKAQAFAEAAGAEAERERARAESLREKSETLAADNAKLYRQEQQAVRVREQILAIVSHDLRNPVGTILLTTAVLAKRGGVVEERRRGLPLALGRIKRAADRMQRLIEDLLDFASIETGRLAITRELHDPGSIIHETLASLEAAAQEKHLLLAAKVQPHLPPVSCDRDRILQVLSNLVGNAFKATGPGGQITLRVERLGDELWFSVADTGRGISKQDLEHLFERYWRSDDAAYKGSGLGLAIAEGILAAHGGRIWAQSEPGQGATFWFALPYVEIISEREKH